MPEETNQHHGATPVNYPADSSTGVSTPSDRLRRQMIKGGAGTVLAVAAVWAGWTKVLFPEGAGAESVPPQPRSTPPMQGGTPAAPGSPAGAAQTLGAVTLFNAGDPPKLVTVGEEKQPYLVENLGDGKFRALSAFCTHKGCTVDWSAKDNALVCPCHYGKFSRDGKNISGPPPTPLAESPTRVENGELVLA
ncbi:MAG: Rieske (2Fe-2S) protein [Capsulimonas sp.]|uniref:Rieske (2Fe-2S) protein n=1 Tax=Capsulimonas sp. TaxID=2494211 RepID=UPI003264AE33